MDPRKVDWESLLLVWTAVVVLAILLGFAGLTGRRLECVLGALGSFLAGGSIVGALAYRLGRKKGRHDNGNSRQGDSP